MGMTTSRRSSEERPTSSVLPQPRAKHLSPTRGAGFVDKPKMDLSGRQAREAALLKMKGESTLARAMSWMKESALY